MLTKAQRDNVLRFIQTVKGTSFTTRDVVRALDFKSEDRRALQRFLDELDGQNVIHRVKRGRYSLPARESLVEGVLSCHRDGYGFVTARDRSRYPRDIFVHLRNMQDAMHGDRVLVKVSKRKRPPRRFGPRRGQDAGDRMEGIVVRVLDKKHSKIVGRFYEHSRFPYVVPLDPQILQDVQIYPHQSGGAKHGQIVVAALTSSASKYQPLSGTIVEVLGDPGSPGIEYKIVEHKYGLPVEFSRETLAEIEPVPEVVSGAEASGREDFRMQESVTIDGESARDFDDAVTLQKLPNGIFRLGVHIADVSHYVREGTALDADAYARGTSVYFPDRSIPMLPPRLSSGICSLKPDEDRLVFSVLMDIDRHGSILQSRFTEGVLRSRRRMTYTAVAKILQDRDPTEIERYAELVPMFRLMEELCLILSQKRRGRGAVDFDLPEAEIRFDEVGRIVSVLPSERTIAHRIIEEFMLAANETVAQHLAASGGPALYRIHEEPDPAKVNDFAAFAITLGYRLESRDGRYRPADFRKFCEQLEGKPEGRFLAYLMLRSFMQAQYSENDAGHFGLATSSYTHFTSPIRRYPDLVVHRLLKESLKPRPSEAWQEQMRERMPEIATHTSERERNADDAEREIEKIKKVEFMSDKIGDEFEGIVYSVTRQGFFVELLDHFVEGFVPAVTLTDDHYLFKEKTHSFVGERNRKHIRLGERVMVRLDVADRESHRLGFSLIR